MLKKAKSLRMGVSYRGFLAATQRLHYPETFFATIASSAPLSGLISDPHDPLVYGNGYGVTLSLSLLRTLLTG